MQKARKFKELILLKRKSLKNFSMFNVFITAKNQELESRFHSSAAQNHINCTLRMYQMFPQLVPSFAYKQMSLYNSHDTECAVTTKELLRKFWNYKQGTNKIRNFKNQALSQVLYKKQRVYTVLYNEVEETSTNTNVTCLLFSLYRFSSLQDAPIFFLVDSPNLNSYYNWKR